VGKKNNGVEKMSKKVLLTYIMKNSGHYRASKAIEAAIRIIAPDSQILNIDGLNYTNPVLEKIINSAYSGIIRATPKVWKNLYDNPKWENRAKKLQNLINSYSWTKLDKLIKSYQPDAIACTQAFPCGMIADYKKRTGSDVPLVAVLTDFMPHAYWVHHKVNAYIVACKAAAERLKAEGVPAGQIYITGIPILPNFSEQSDKMLAARRFKINLETPIILIMGGGQGLGPMKQIIQEIDKIQMQCQIIVVTGTNKLLMKSIKNLKTKCKNPVILLGCTDLVGSLMDISTIIITKAGGLTTSEALVKGLPIVISKSIPGQEENNAQFIVSEGAGIRAEAASDVAGCVKDLLMHPAKREQMSKNAKKIAFPNSALDAAKLIMTI
jgi:processive 1,2-diacylglycerol beta-glucosyltransferase